MADFEYNQKYASPKIIEFHNRINADKRWRACLMEGKWLDAIKGLDELAEVNPEKLAFATLKKTEIQVNNIKDLCSNDEERKLFISAAMS